VSSDTATGTGEDRVMHASAHMPWGNHGPCEAVNTDVGASIEDPDRGNCCAIGIPEWSSCGVSSNTATCTCQDQGMHASACMPMGNHRTCEAVNDNVGTSNCN